VGRKILPDPNIKLTPGQIVYLGGLLGYEIRNISSVDPRIADYGVAPIYYRGKDDYCNDRPTWVADDPDVWEIFDIVAKEASTVWLRPKKGGLGKFVVVDVVPKSQRRFKKFMSNLAYGLFIRPVDEDLYREVLKKGSRCDEELYACAVARRIRVEERVSREVRQLLGVPPVEEAVKEEVAKLRAEIIGVINEILAKSIEKFAEEMVKAMQRRSATVEKVIPYAKITSKLMDMYGVYKVEWHDGTATIYCGLDVVDDVRKAIEELGGVVKSVYKSKFIAFIDADFSGVTV